MHPAFNAADSAAAVLAIALVSPIFAPDPLSLCFVLLLQLVKGLFCCEPEHKGIKGIES